MTSFVFHPEAQAEYFSAIVYYEACRPGIGKDFVTEVEETVQRILAHPGAWPSMVGTIRRCMLRGFPYGLIYSEVEGVIVVLAVAHAKRAPGYWRSRSAHST